MARSGTAVPTTTAQKVTHVTSEIGCRCENGGGVRKEEGKLKIILDFSDPKNILKIPATTKSFPTRQLPTATKPPQLAQTITKLPKMVDVFEQYSFSETDQRKR